MTLSERVGFIKNQGQCRGQCQGQGQDQIVTLKKEKGLCESQKRGSQARVRAISNICKETKS